MTASPRDANRVPGLIVSDSVASTPLVVSGFSLSGIGAAAVAIVDGSGNQITSFGGGTQYTDGDAAATHPVGTGIIYNNSGTYQFVSAANPLPVAATITPSGTQDVNLTKVGGTAFALGQQLAAASLPVVLTAAQISTLTPLSTVAVTQSTSPWVVSNGGTFAVQSTLQTGSNQIGHLEANQSVNVAQMNGVTVTMGNGAAGTGVQRMTLASDSTGNIATIGTSVTPGTSAAHLGKAEDAVAASGDTGVFALAVRNETLTAPTSTDGDYSQISVGSGGEVIVQQAPLTAGVNGKASATGTSDTEVIAAQGAGYYIYITSLQVVNTGSTTSLISIEYDTGGTPTILAYTIAPTGGGSNIEFPTPLKVPTSNKNIGFKAGSASTTIYVSMQGFKSKV